MSFFYIFHCRWCLWHNLFSLIVTTMGSEIELTSSICSDVEPTLLCVFAKMCKLISSIHFWKISSSNMVLRCGNLACQYPSCSAEAVWGGLSHYASSQVSKMLHRRQNYLLLVQTCTKSPSLTPVLHLRCWKCSHWHKCDLDKVLNLP